MYGRYLIPRKFLLHVMYYFTSLSYMHAHGLYGYVYIYTQLGDAPLHTAGSLGSVQMTKLLLSKGACVNDRNKVCIQYFALKALSVFFVILGSYVCNIIPVR